MTGRLPITARGPADDQGRRRHVHARVGRSLRRDHPEDRAAGAPQLLLAHARKIPTGSTWTTPSSFRRASGKFASARRPRLSCNEARLGRAPVVSSPASMDPLASALQYLKGVGPRRAADLQRVGLATVEDLLYRFPIRYEDRGAFQTIASLRPGMAASVLGEVISCRHQADAPAPLQDFRDAGRATAPARCAPSGSISRSSPTSSTRISASSCSASSS